MKLKNNPFYSIIKPSDRALVREHIERAKRSSPIGRDYRGSGGHAYTKFSVLKVSHISDPGQGLPYLVRCESLLPHLVNCRGTRT
jgi:hypothetical protein